MLDQQGNPLVLETGVSPDALLAVEVLLQALRDAGLLSQDGFSTNAAPPEVTQAKLFLTAQSGAWRASRESWCITAGVDPDYFSSIVTRVMNGELALSHLYARRRPTITPRKTLEAHPRYADIAARVRELRDRCYTPSGVAAVVAREFEGVRESLLYQLISHDRI